MDIFAFVADHVSVAVPVDEYETGFGESVTEQVGARGTGQVNSRYVHGLYV